MCLSAIGCRRDFQYSSMSLTDSNDNLSIGPLLVLTTVAGRRRCVRAGPAGTVGRGQIPTRNGSLSIDNARPSTIVLHPATRYCLAAAQAIARPHRRRRIARGFSWPSDRPVDRSGPLAGAQMRPRLTQLNSGLHANASRLRHPGAVPLVMRRDAVDSADRLRVAAHREGHARTHTPTLPG